jgi:hypothetical protein
MIKGQAASTDALIFLTIVSGIFVLIVGYGLTYGNDIINTADKVYKENYHNSALKSFMSASGSRDGNAFNDSKYRDSISTLIKEDYGVHGDINYYTKLSTFLVLEDIFKPYPQRNYFLTINHSSISGANQVATHLISFLKVFVDEDTKYYVCQNSFSITNFLESNTLDLIFVEGKFLLFKDILEDNATKVDGSIYLGSWLAQDVNESYFESDCNDLSSDIINPN